MFHHQFQIIAYKQFHLKKKKETFYTQKNPIRLDRYVLAMRIHKFTLCKTQNVKPSFIPFIPEFYPASRKNYFLLRSQNIQFILKIQNGKIFFQLAPSLNYTVLSCFLADYSPPDYGFKCKLEEIMTELGPCFTFNMLNGKETYSIEYWHHLHCRFIKISKFF